MNVGWLRLRGQANESRMMKRDGGNEEEGSGVSKSDQ